MPQPPEKLPIGVALSVGTRQVEMGNDVLVVAGQPIDITLTVDVPEFARVESLIVWPFHLDTAPTTSQYPLGERRRAAAVRDAIINEALLLPGVHTLHAVVTPITAAESAVSLWVAWLGIPTSKKWKSVVINSHLQKVAWYGDTGVERPLVRFSDAEEMPA
jgi:hypothetical protein